MYTMYVKHSLDALVDVVLCVMRTWISSYDSVNFVFVLVPLAQGLCEKNEDEANDLEMDFWEESRLQVCDLRLLSINSLSVFRIFWESLWSWKVKQKVYFHQE